MLMKGYKKGVEEMKGKKGYTQITQCPDAPREHYIQNYEKQNNSAAFVNLTEMKAPDSI